MWRSDERRSKIGANGEEVATNFLIGKGHRILARNYRQKWGEIDVITKKEGTIHFVEVKSISREIQKNVSSETDDWRPEDNIHLWKLKRMARTIETYLLEKNVSDETAWQIDVIAVRFENDGKRAYVRHIPNVVL